MPSRRRLLAAIGTTGVAATTLPRLLEREFAHEVGRSVLHPASDDVLAADRGLDGGQRRFAGVVTGSVNDWTGPDMSDGMRTSLVADDNDGFHLVFQYDSTPDDPRLLQVETATNRPFGPIRADVTVRPWGSLSDIEDQSRRRRLQSAATLRTTTIATFSPPPDDLPEAVDAEYTVVDHP